jgi:NADH-quinone oxidoreductase subunit A
LVLFRIVVLASRVCRAVAEFFAGLTARQYISQPTVPAVPLRAEVVFGIVTMPIRPLMSGRMTACAVLLRGVRLVHPTVDLIIQFGIMLAIGVLMAIAFISISHLLAPKSTNPNKSLPYECGVVPKTDARAPFNVHYYLVAVLFVLFDLEAVFIYPWAVALSSLGTVALAEMFVFVVVLLVGFVYAWKKGVFEWE